MIQRIECRNHLEPRVGDFSKRALPFVASWIFICNVFVTALFSQCLPTDLNLPNTTISSGNTAYAASNSITAASGFVVNGSASVTFEAGNIVSLEPGFHATTGTATMTFHATAGAMPVPVIATSTLPAGIVGTSYSQTLCAAGGTGPYTWSVPLHQSLPPGLAISSSAGILSGSPAAPNAGFSVPLQVTDSHSSTASKTLTMVVSASSGPSVIAGPSELQANLTYMPFNYYDTDNGVGTPASQLFPNSCPSNSTIRSCIQAVLKNLHNEGVDGIRIYFYLCGSESGPLANCGSPWTSVSFVTQNSLWFRNVQKFFQDVHDAGISKITLTPAHFVTYDAIFGPMYHTLPKSMTSSPGGVPCSDTPDTVYFFYGLPYGARQVVDPTGAIFYFPIGQNDNNGYNCAPINPYFVGWQNQYDVINAMLSAASIASLTVFEVDFVPELDVTDFPAMGRFVVDNAQANSDPNAIGSFAVVRDRLRDKMTGNGFDPGGVTWSAAWANSTLGGYDCTAVYGVSARAITLGGVSSAIGGGYIGTPDNTSFNNQLLCGGVVGTMQLMPYGSYQPNIVDIHLYDAVSVDASILVMHPEYAMVQSEATLDFTDISNYLTIVQLQSSVVVLGETHSNTYDNDPMYLGLTCEHVAPYTAASQIVAGFNDANNALKGHSIVFRPWIELQWPSGFCFTPNNQHVNLNGQGPYTPSQFTP